MKKKILSIIIINIFSLPIFCQNQAQVHFFRVIAFHKKYQFYCTLNACGYYRYQIDFNEKTVFLTYEGQKFYEQSLFDPDFTLITPLYPLTLWTNQKGEMFRLKKAYAPVIDRDKKKTGTPYGYDCNTP